MRSQLQSLAIFLFVLSIVSAWSAAYLFSAASPQAAEKSSAPLPRTLGRPPRVDAFGDAVPEGVYARLGTVRFRPGMATAALVFAPGGKVLASSGRFDGICLWDIETGAP